MNGLARASLAAMLGVGLAAGALRAQSITGLEKGRKPEPEGPAELLARLRAEGAPRTDSRNLGPTALGPTIDAAVAALGEPLKGKDADRFTREKLVTLKLAMLRARAELQAVGHAVESGEVPAAEGRARVVDILAGYSELVGGSAGAHGSPSSGAERR